MLAVRDLALDREEGLVLADGATTLRPGMAIAQFSMLWLCWAPNRSPAPLAVRSTIGIETWPSVM